MALYPIPVDGIVALTLRSRLFGQAILNTVHYQNRTGSVIDDGGAYLDQMLTDMETDAEQWPAKLFNVTSEDLKGVSLVAQVIYPVRRVQRVEPIALIGADAAAALPQNMAACITKQSEFAGRGKNGRMEVAGLVATQTDEGLWQPATVALLEVLGDAIKQDYEPSVGADGPLTAIIFNKTSPLDSSVIESTIVQTTVRVMRRRTVGVGI